MAQRFKGSPHDHVKGIIMNVKQFAIAVSLVLAGSAAMAVEATQWNPATGGQSRGEVKAELRQAAANGELDERGETYGSFTVPHPHAPARAFAFGKSKTDEQGLAKHDAK